MWLKFFIGLLSLIALVSQANSANIARVEIPSLDQKLTLSAYLNIPNSPNPLPAIILLHGCSGIGLSGSLSSHLAAWMQHLGKSGFATLAIDSAGPRGYNSTCAQRSKRREMLRERPSDAYAGLQYLHNNSEIDGTKIGLMGWSQGGAITLLSIANQSIGRPTPPPPHDFRAAIAFYPSTCNDRLQSRPFTKVEPNTWMPIAPLQVFFGASDNITNPIRCKVFIDSVKARGNPASIKVFDNAHHAFDAPNLKLRHRRDFGLIGGKLPTIGTNEVARNEVLKLVPGFFHKHLNE